MKFILLIIDKSSFCDNFRRNEEGKRTDVLQILMRVYQLMTSVPSLFKFDHANKRGKSHKLKYFFKIFCFSFLRHEMYKLHLYIVTMGLMCSHTVHVNYC